VCCAPRLLLTTVFGLMREEQKKIFANFVGLWNRAKFRENFTFWQVQGSAKLVIYFDFFFVSYRIFKISFLAVLSLIFRIFFLYCTLSEDTEIDL
jgi:hypothetical protein